MNADGWSKQASWQAHTHMQAVLLVWAYAASAQSIFLGTMKYDIILVGLCISSPAGQDYQAVTNMRLGPFGNSDRRQCFDVNITNDAEPEDPEDFMVIVQFCPGEAQPERVDIDPQTATTTIMDDDGELHVIADCNIK